MNTHRTSPVNSITSNFMQMASKVYQCCRNPELLAGDYEEQLGENPTKLLNLQICGSSAERIDAKAAVAGKVEDVG